MAQYIDKDALVAELKKRISDYWSDSENTIGIYPYALEEVIKYIDTLEVKEVDLEKEIEFYWLKRCDLTWCKDIYSATHIREMFSNIARHFFELGLKAQKGE